MDCNFNTAIHKFVARQRELLDLELQAEKEESSLSTGDSQNKGSKNNSHHQEKTEGRRSHVLGRLEASDVSVGLYGRTVVTLTLWCDDASVVERERDVADANTGKASGTSSSLHLLPANRFAVGNEVELRAKNNGGQTNHKKNKNAMSGVICAVTEASISVAISEDERSSSSSKGKDKDKGKWGNQNKSNPNDPDHDDETSVLDSAPLTLVPRSSIEVHKKLVAALDRLEKHGAGHPVAGSIIRSVFAAPSSPLHSEGVLKPKRDATATANQYDNTNTRCFNPGLDASQREAIAFALHPDRPVALIHGPPGTGKTTTVAELIRQAVHHHGMRVLVTAPSNVAVDNILEKLTLSEDGHRERVLPTLRTVRLGHPARIKPSIAQHGLEALVQSSDGTEIVHDVRRELESHLRSLSGGHRNGTRTSTGSRGSAAKQQNSIRPTPKGRRDKLDRRAIYREIKELRKEVRQREEKVVGELIRSAHVVLATTVGAGNRVLNQITNPRDGHNGNANGNGSQKPGFDLVIIDEAAQALEASCWIPILRGRKVVLAGDHCQLPPTIKSNDPKVVEGLGVTLFERLMGLSSKSSSSSSNNNYQNRYENRDISRMLQIQYRMHHKIADWASQAMYHGGLSTHNSVRNRTLGQLDSVRNRKDTNFNSMSEPPNIEDGDMDLRKTTLMLIDTAGCDLHERETEAGSRYNEGEAMLVGNHVRKLLELGVDQNQVAVITPYNGQVELLRNQLLPEFPKLEIRSVDGFQGGEREAVVLSLVRSSDRRGGRNKASPGIGFLKDDRRQNVAVTRAKRHLAVVCDSETVSQSPFIQSLLQWVGEHGEERSAIEYISESTHSASHQEYEDDLKVAESELMKLIEEPSLTAATATAAASNITKEKYNRKGDAPAIKSSKKPPAVPQKALEESKRKALMDKIAGFVETGTKGEEMILSTELSSFDRRLVHEFAEQSGLGHRSEGRENIDRKIILWIQNESPATILGRQQLAAAATSKTKAKDETIGAAVSSEIMAQKEQDNDIASAPKLVSNFLALALDDDDDDSESEIQNATEGSSAGVPSANLMLAQLARERAERQRQQQQRPLSGPSNTGTSSSKKKKKPKGKKLGGPIKPPPPQPKKEDGLDDLDDMAFLDAQIEKSQNTHGRKVAGRGKNYRTVVNGILNSKPESKSKPTNSKANAALQSKLSQAKNSRNKKKKKK